MQAMRPLGEKLIMVSIVRTETSRESCAALHRFAPVKLP